MLLHFRRLLVRTVTGPIHFRFYVLLQSITFSVIISNVFLSGRAGKAGQKSRSWLFRPKEDSKVDQNGERRGFLT